MEVFVLKDVAELYKSDKWNLFSDSIGVPDLAAGAMENWGLVTYRQQNILVDEKYSTERDKFLVARTIAHELAHQVLPAA